VFASQMQIRFFWHAASKHPSDIFKRVLATVPFFKQNEIKIIMHLKTINDNK
jgi:hypothetical protein